MKNNNESKNYTRADTLCLFKTLLNSRHRRVRTANVNVRVIVQMHAWPAEIRIENNKLYEYNKKSVIK